MCLDKPLPARASSAFFAAVVGVLLAASDALQAAAGPAQITTPHGPVDFDAAHLEVDYRTQQVTAQKPIITQGDLRVTANRAEATGLNFDDSRWTFTGDVHITSARQGDLRSDRAVVVFRDNRMQSALVTGHPAEFEQTSSKSGVLARGHADSIEYTVSTDTVRLTDDAWLEYGDNQKITAPVLVYNIREQRLQAASTPTPSGRVHFTLVPTKRPKPAEPTRNAPGSASAAPGTTSTAPGSVPATPASAPAAPREPAAGAPPRQP